MHARLDAPNLSGTARDLIAKGESVMRRARRHTPRRQSRDAKRCDGKCRAAMGAGQPLIRFIPAHGSGQHRSSARFRKPGGASRQAHRAGHGDGQRISETARRGMAKPCDHAAKTIQQQQARGISDRTGRPIPGEGNHIIEIAFRACGHT